MSELLTITGAQLAERLQTNPASIRAYRAGQRSPAFLAGLPEPIQSQPRLLWLVADINAWIESRRTFRPDTPTDTTQSTAPQRKRGRPRNISRARSGSATGTHSTTAAYHEAGHAVAAVVLGVRFDSVFVLGDSGRITPRRVDGLPVRWPDDPATAVFTAAGPVAEARQARRSLFNVLCDGGAADYNDLGGHDVDAVIAHARQMLRQHWRAVESVAGALLERGILEESDVALLVSAAARATEGSAA